MSLPTGVLAGLSARLEQVESQLRRWKAVSLVVAVVSGAIVSGALVGAGVTRADKLEPMPLRAKSVESQEFVLKDAGGATRARLRVRADQTSLEFYDDKGNVVWSAPTTVRVVPAR